MSKLDRIRELVAQLNIWRDEYYNQARPSVSDAEYDKAFDELKALEQETGVILGNSPTQTVGYTIVEGLQKVQHSIPLLSLDKTKLVEDVVKFAGGRDLVAMLKLDGLTIELEYDNGEFIKGSTRGDGSIGEDITHNVPSFMNVPTHIPYKQHLKVSGEALIHRHDFEAINATLPDDKKYKTPRNLAAGSVRQLDSKECAERKIYFYAYNVLEPKGKTKTNDIMSLDSLGFDIVGCTLVPGNIIDAKLIDKAIVILKHSAEDEGIPIDGIVFTFDDMEYGESLGVTSHHPLHSKAFKFEDETAETTLRDIEWSMGRTGQLTPVAIFDSVDLDGTEVSRASLHNISIMEELLGKPYIGQKIQVYKANMIIPCIYSAEKIEEA
jgi:DNA ligase (NAD+)